MSAMLSQLLSLALGVRPLRRRVIFDVTQLHYKDLQIAIPLSHGLSCPVMSSDAWFSFSEIFVQGEYNQAFCRIDLPSRWIDLGCYAGYFSLYVAWCRARQQIEEPFEALLVDGDERVASSVTRLIESNNFHKRMIFRNGIISKDEGIQNFVQRSCMSSSMSLDSGEKAVHRIRTLTASDILILLRPPYDLVKVDIEGGEHDFLIAYQGVLEQTRHLLLEWHPWHSGGGGKQEIVALAKSAGFEILYQTSVKEEPAAAGGLILFKNTKQGKGDGQP